VHQAYIASRKDYDDRMVLKTEILNAGKKEQEVIKEMKLSLLMTLSLYKDNN
jgi:hypothetical protein